MRVLWLKCSSDLVTPLLRTFQHCIISLWVSSLLLHFLPLPSLLLPHHLCTCLACFLLRVFAEETPSALVLAVPHPTSGTQLSTRSFPHHLHFIHLHWASYIKLLTTPKPPFPCPWLTFPQSPHHQLIFYFTLFVCLTFLTSKARSMRVWIQICCLSPPSRRVPGMQ